MKLMQTPLAPEWNTGNSASEPNRNRPGAFFFAYASVVPARLEEVLIIRRLGRSPPHPTVSARCGTHFRPRRWALHGQMIWVDLGGEHSDKDSSSTSLERH